MYFLWSWFSFWLQGAPAVCLRLSIYFPAGFSIFAYAAKDINIGPQS